MMCFYELQAMFTMHLLKEPKKQYNTQRKSDNLLLWILFTNVPFY